MSPRLFLVVPILVLAATLGPPAYAQGHEGRTNRHTHESGDANSGDAIAGQVTATSGAGDASVDATNLSDHAMVQTGDATGYDDIARITEPSDDAETSDVTVADIRNPRFESIRRQHFIDTITMSGDGIAGQVIGVVTKRGGEAAVVAANSSLDDMLGTGDSKAHDSGDASTGASLAGQELADVSSGRSSLDATNLSQEVDATTGDALAFFDDATSTTGDSIGGQLAALATGGSGLSDVDLANVTDAADLDTGDAWSNDATAITGDSISGESAAVVANGTTSLDATNLSSETDTTTGDARALEDTHATSGDGITGLVVGVVTPPHDESDVTLANTSMEIDVLTGDVYAATSKDLTLGHRSTR